MADLAPVIFAALSENAGVAALVTDSGGARIYPEYNRAADRVYPLLVYRIENVSSLSAADGVNGAETADAIVAAIAETYAEAEALGLAVQLALDGAAGTEAGLVVQGIFLKEDGVADDLVTEPQTEAILFYMKELTFTAAYSRA